MTCLANLMKMSLFRFCNYNKSFLLFCTVLEVPRLTLEQFAGADEGSIGNYVVQKVPESLALSISRIKVNLNALKRYTYRKQIAGLRKLSPWR